MNTVLLEFLEIYILQVLYLRGIYPKQIFRKQKAYSLPVYCSIYPPLNNYLNAALQNVADMKELDKIEILIYSTDDDDSRESFVVGILNDIQIADSESLINLNEHFRQCLCNLELQCKALNKINRSKFKILLHTKDKAYQELCENSGQVSDMALEFNNFFKM